jgi:hypothetical protein
MANAATTPSTLVGYLKPVFGDLQKVMPEECPLQKAIPFKSGELVGKYFEEPIQVRRSWGLTFCGSAGGMTDLVDALPSQTESAQVTPFLSVLRDQVSTSMIDRAGEGGKQSFQKFAAYQGGNLTAQMRCNIEISMLCGQQGIGTIASTSGTTSQVWTISAATLRSGILAILEGAYVDLYQSDLSTPVTNAQAVLVSAVDPDAGTITVTTPSNPTSNVAGYVIFIRGANSSGTFNEMVGLRKQIGTTTGTVFNVAKTYSAWRGNVVTSIGAFGPGAILNCAARARSRGFMGRLVSVISPKAYSVLNSLIIANQSFDQSYSMSKIKEGTDAIELRGGNGVVIEIMEHGMQADGEIMMFPKEYVKRIGSAMENSTDKEERDLSFRIPGSADEYVVPVAGKTAVEYQVRTDQQVFNQRPSWSVLGTGITYT